jgi:hypothetical protein
MDGSPITTLVGADFGCLACFASSESQKILGHDLGVAACFAHGGNPLGTAPLFLGTVMASDSNTIKATEVNGWDGTFKYNNDTLGTVTSGFQF